MSYTSTTRLSLKKAVPGSAQPFETSVFNSNWDAIDAEAVAADGRLDVLEAINASGRLNTIEASDVTQNSRLTAVEGRATTVEGRATSLEGRATSIEGVNTTQDGRLSTLEARSGRNVLINGAMDIWQRGTSSTAAGYQTADRWFENASGTTTFAQDTANLPGSNFQYAMKMTAGVTTVMSFQQVIETKNTIPLVGNVVTFSAYLAASVTTNVSLIVYYSTATDNPATGTWTQIANISTSIGASYGRATNTVTIPGTAKTVLVQVATATVASGVSVWATGLQLELGAIATAFNRAGGDYQGELAKCQRYYYRAVATAAYDALGFGFAYLTSSALISMAFPVVMRAVPALDAATIASYRLTDTVTTASLISIGSQNSTATFPGTSTQMGVISATVSGTPLTQFRPQILGANNTAGAWVGWSAEL